MARLRIFRRPRTARSVINARGSILIITLWSVSLLSVFVVILGFQVRQKMALVNRLEEKAELRFIADAGVKRAISSLKTESENLYNCMSDISFNDPGAFKDVSVGAGRFIVSYDYSCDPSKASETRYGLIDENRKININTAEIDILKRLFRSVLNTGETNTEALAACIVDWRDGDDALSIPTGSAESSYYRGLTSAYEAKNADLEAIDELYLVRGVNQSVFDRIKDYVTIYGSGMVNVNTASKPVLIALGLNEYLADNIILFRLGKDGLPGTGDDGFFDSTSAIAPKLSQFADLSSSDIAVLTAVAGQYLAVRSDAFKICSLAVLRNGRAALTTAVVNKDGKILYWQEP